MKKIFALAILLILVSGCDGSTGTSKTDSTSAGTGSFISGEGGLRLEFFTGAPPDTIWDQDYPFGINIKIVNEGEFDILDTADATLTITGIDPADFGTTAGALSQNVPEPLIGKHKDPNGNIVEGTTTTIDFADLQYIGEVTGTQKFTLRANICYRYGTYSLSKLCVLEDLIGTTRKRGESPFCDPNANQEVENSAAPLHITDFKQSVVGRDKISFQFVIKHEGKGRFSHPGSECSLDLAEQDVVYLKVDTGLSGLSCSGLKGGTTEGFINMYGETGAQERTIVCTQTINPDRTDFEKPVNIEITYDYEAFEPKEIEIKHIE